MRQEGTSVGYGFVVRKRGTRTPLSSGDFIRFQCKAARGLPIAKMVRDVQRIMNLRLFKCRSLIFAQEPRALSTTVRDAA